MNFIRDWALIISMTAGVLAYFAYSAFEPSQEVRALAWQAVTVAQPVFIFAMLFLSFCGISPRDIRPCRWHLPMLLIQCGLFAGIGLILILLPHSPERVVLEGAMICLICPTATASGVVTRKLGGSIEHVTTYIILINLAASIMVPVMLPFVHPNPNMHFVSASLLIMGKVFPLLLFPLICAMLLRRLAPKALARIQRYPDAAFYIWTVSLALAMTVTTRSIMHSSVSLGTEAWLVAVSLVCCAFQFWAGKKLGKPSHDSISAGQAFGQKNTVFAIWLGYTFFTPITSIVGGFYSIWHNVVNSYQLYKHSHKHKASES